MATKFLFKDAAGNRYKFGNNYISLPDPSLYVNNFFIPFVPEGSSKDVSVLSTLMNSWNPSSGAATWITFSNILNNQGKGWGSFRATAASNSVGNRTGSINIISKYNNWTINASQNQIVIADSVSTDLGYLDFDSDGIPLTSGSVTVTSSGTWSTSKIDTGDGTSWLTKVLPSSGSDQGTCNFLLQSGYFGVGRSCIVRFIVGTATCDVQIEQFGFV